MVFILFFSVIVWWMCRFNFNVQLFKNINGLFIVMVVKRFIDSFKHFRALPTERKKITDWCEGFYRQIDIHCITFFFSYFGNGTKTEFFLSFFVEAQQSF